jgi:hypothetical protein
MNKMEKVRNFRDVQELENNDLKIRRMLDIFSREIQSIQLNDGE